jgi:hypothetical protein
MALVAEVTAGFEQLTHIEGGKRHGWDVLFRLNLRETREKTGSFETGPPERRAGLWVRQAQVPRVGWAVFNVCRPDLQGVSGALLG